jgi:PDZ domain
MNSYSKCIGILIILFLSQSLAFAQMVKIEAEGDVFNLPEVEAVIARQDGKIEVLFTHSGMRTEKYKDVDLKTNDEIFMANGQKLTSVEQLKQIYEKLDIGAALKIAVKRDDKDKIVSIVKADPKNLPKRKIKMEKVTDDNPKDASTGAEKKKIIMKTETKKDD